MDRKKLQSVIESLLFVSGEPVRVQKLAKIAGVSKNEAEAAVGGLAEKYSEKSGLRIVKKGDSFQLATSPENDEFVSRLVSGELHSELSKSALETLSIVAYRGPVTRSQIEMIRGVDSSFVLRSLLLRSLVERKETSDVRGYIYEISFDFLKNLGLEKIEQLPSWDKLSRNEKVEELISEDQAEETKEKDA